MKTKILTDFQICISVPFRTPILKNICERLLLKSTKRFTLENIIRQRPVNIQSLHILLSRYLFFNRFYAYDLFLYPLKTFFFIPRLQNYMCAIITITSLVKNKYTRTGQDTKLTKSHIPLLVSSVYLHENKTI